VAIGKVVVDGELLVTTEVVELAVRRTTLALATGRFGRIGAELVATETIGEVVEVVRDLFGSVVAEGEVATRGAAPISRIGSVVTFGNRAGPPASGGLNGFGVTTWIGLSTDRPGNSGLTRTGPTTKRGR